MIETERLHIYPASKEEMKDFISSQTNDVLKTAYQEMLDKIPSIENEETIPRYFSAKVQGDINKDNYIKEFSWMN